MHEFAMALPLTSYGSWYDSNEYLLALHDNALE